MRLFLLWALLLVSLSAWADNDALREAQRREYQRCMDTTLRESPSGTVGKEDEELCVNEASVKAWLRTPSPNQEAAPQTAPQDSGKTAALFRSCLRKEIAQLDDGVSPASDIAYAVRGACSDAFKALGGVYAGLPPQHKARLTQEIATREILAVRASKRKVKD